MLRITVIAIVFFVAGCVTDSSDWSTGNITKSGDTLKADTTRLRGPER
jgi:hypothetical protein